MVSRFRPAMDNRSFTIDNDRFSATRRKKGRNRAAPMFAGAPQPLIWGRQSFS